MNKLLQLIKSKKALLVMGIVAVLGWAGFTVSESDVSSVVDIIITEEEEKISTQQNEVVTEKSSEIEPKQKSTTQEFNQASSISPERRAHILYGDATGGGHLFGAGKPCKSEFPKHWDEKTVIKEVEMIAANDNLNWEQQRNGYHVTEQKVGTVKVRVVKDRENKNVITAYPTNTGRNHCPANDNY